MRLIVPVVFCVITLVSCASIENEVKTKAETNISYASNDGVAIDAYLALPDHGGAAPGVLMIHEWWGLNQDVTILADALAREGYVVLAADAFRGKLATSVPEAILQVRTTPQSQIHADLDAALDYLRSRPEVDADRVGVMGFCFGGRHSMQLGTRATGLSAVVTLYGSGLITDPEAVGNLPDNGPILGIFGEDDRSIPLREVREFEAALDQTGSDTTITIYPEVGHAFVKSSTFMEGGAPSQAWNQVTEFFDRTL